MVCDTTFGVTREQNDLFAVTGIDIHNKVLTAMRCFLPSKEIKAYYWAMKTDLRYIITDTTLSFNQYIACDKELAIHQPLRAIMDNVPCLYKSYNRLDK